MTQAPSSAERKRARHHLVLCRDPGRTYDAAAFARAARRLIARIRARKRLPLVVGGTGLYVQALLDGLFPGPGRNPRLRRALEAEAAKRGTGVLYARLSAKDPAAAAKIHPNDLRRIIRALEVIETTGEKFSDLTSRRKGLAAEEPVRLYGLRPERSRLYGWIDARTERMFQKGVVPEVKRLLRKRLSFTARMCLGIREIGAHLAGKATREEAIEALKRETRRYAKRQIAWFKRDPRIRWIDVGPGMSAADVADIIAGDLRAASAVDAVVAP